MTKIQNYQGQVIYIPNRNIAIAGKYIKGCFEGYVDVALPSENEFVRAKESVVILSDALHRQFDEVFLEKTRIEPVLSFQTGEYFLRIHVSIWPGQTWVIEQQLIPRLRELFIRDNIVIPSDRIVSFYHLRREQVVAKLSERIAFFRLLRTRARKDQGKGNDS